MPEPLHWKRYLPAVGKSPGADLLRFAARYRVASSFASVQMDGVKPGTAEAYSAATRVTLSYQALGSLVSALEGARAKVRLADPVLARDYRSGPNARLRESLEGSASEPRLRQSLERLGSDPSDDDVACVARAVQLLLGRGDFWDVGVVAARSGRARTLMDALADALLTEADRRFELYLDREALGPWSITRAPMCPSCGAAIGARHTTGCEIARCGTHGAQRRWCMDDGRHSTTRYWGVFPGTIEALKRGWTVKVGGRVVPDLNRVMLELDWDPSTEMYR
jgi:hypothetical protein